MEALLETPAPSEKTAIPRKRIRLSSCLNNGGIANLHNAFNSAGDTVVFRQLRPEFKFRWSMRRKFTQGIRVRRELGAHPHIVQYLGEGGWLRPYEVIEYVPGNNLKNMIFNSDPVVRRFQMQILEQIATGMAVVHAAGWLHLDIKPENVMVMWNGKRLQLKLTDFDMALPIGTTQAPRHAGGSMAYLAPEFLSRHEVSISTDVFAFGVLTYHLFTGQMPFLGSVQNNLAKGDYEITFPTTQHGKVPEPVQDFICRCLAADPVRRFCDDSELLNGLKSMQRKVENPPKTVASER